MIAAGHPAATNVVLRAVLLVIASLGGACLPDASPCPPGLRPDPAEDRCVPDIPLDASLDAGLDASPDGARDAPPDAAPDATPDPDDASIDAYDADPGDADADTPAPRCAEEDLARWRALHVSGALVATVARCSREGCTSTPCDVSGCLGRAAEMSECDDCVAAESDCATRRCANPCTLGTDAECRACLCEARCTASFEACAHAELGLCDDVHGRDATSDELRVPVPYVFRRKSLTGFTRVSPFFADDPAREVERRGYAAVGWTHFVTFGVGSTDYLLEHLGACAQARCPTRVSPVLADGSLGRPVYEDEWSRGFDVMTPLRVSGDLYLLLYKSGAATTEVEPRGAARILRITAGASAPGLHVEAVLDRPWTPSVGPTWSHIRAFAAGGQTYLLHYRAGASSATELVRVERRGDSLRFERVADDLVIEPDWDVLETFPVGARWFLFQYSRTRRVAWISALDPAREGGLELGLPLYAATWSERWTGVHPYRTPSTTYLLRRDERTGEVEHLRLPADPTAWRQGAELVVAQRSWGTDPPWDVVAVARARLWEAP